MGAAIDNWILVALLLNNLDTKYKDFIHRLVTQLDDIPNFNKIVTLLHEEDRLLRKDVKEQAMAASLKRFHKEQEEKKNSRSGNDSGRGGKASGRGRGNNNNANDRASKNPNSSNYKGDGDAPECSKCTPLANGNKKKHWPLDCWSLHPEKMPERLKSKSKANVATENDRPNDFVDNVPHMSAMAHLISCEEDTEGDDKYWGLEAASPTPKCGGGAALEVPIYCALDQEISSLQENTETESLTRLHLAGDASQEITGSPLLSLILEEEISTHISTHNFASNATENTETKLLTQLHLAGDASQEITGSPLPSPSLEIHAYAAGAMPPTMTHDWMIDSGCTNHMYFNKEEFTGYQPYRAGISIADGTTVWTKGRGTVEMEWLVPDGSSNVMSVNDVLHVPALACGLFSISQATRKGFTIKFEGDDCHIFQGTKLVGSAPKVNNTYVLGVTQSTASVAMLIQALTTSLNEEAVELWHRRMGHLNEADLKRLVNISKGITLSQKPHMKAICEACSKAKSSRKVSRRAQHEILEKLGKIHMDLGGPLNVASINGAKFYMLLTDQATLRTWCYTYQQKGETFKLFSQWKTKVETQSGCKLKIVRFDNGTEFINEGFKQHFKDSGIICEPTVAYTPEQNGLSEVQNRIVMSGVRAMLFDSKLTRYLWSELLQTKVYQKNRSPTSRLKGVTPHEAWTGEKPFLGHMRIIGCVAWVHIPKEKRKKLDERSKKCYLIGYEGTNIFRV